MMRAQWNGVGPGMRPPICLWPRNPVPSGPKNRAPCHLKPFPRRPRLAPATLFRSVSYIRIRLLLLARLMQDKYSNYETRDTSSPVSGALSDPRLPSARHPQATLPNESDNAICHQGVSQSAGQRALSTSEQVVSLAKDLYPRHSWLVLLSCAALQLR